MMELELMLIMGAFSLAEGEVVLFLSAGNSYTMVMIMND
jgi:hypothetical protein